MNGQRSTASIDKRIPEMLEVDVVGEQRHDDANNYVPRGPIPVPAEPHTINCLSCEDWGRRINGGLSYRSICVLLKVLLPGRANTSRHGEVTRPGIYPDQDDARQQAADFNVTFNQHGQRDQADRREVSPPIEVESAT